ncbi:hypothetical protein DPMN_190559 [Dreissena polymorpha]|uniref:Uncharacterized protein n=1 Tax=Dreissena polymorpha TaxID=45954 RepID=A0A9D4IBV2_DREPO|nr:hypothetical protein DPMN_069257 [Dreissena polymorpha]KAH3755860.1 hypothetical protein DPMN_190559 [Dreissena polymorpha]
MPILFDVADVASSILVPLKSLGLSLERPGRELPSSPYSPVSVSLEVPSTAHLSGTHQSAVDGHEVKAISSGTPMETTHPTLSLTIYLF